MNLKRIFGAILTVLGVIGLIYTAFLAVNSTESNQTLKTALIYGVLGFVFLLRELAWLKLLKMNLNLLLL